MCVCIYIHTCMGMCVYTCMGAYMYICTQTGTQLLPSLQPQTTLYLKPHWLPRSCGLLHSYTFFLETDKEVIPNLWLNMSLSSRLSPFTWHPRPQNQPHEYGQGIESCSFSLQREETDFGGLIHQPKIKDTKEGGHIVSHDSVAEPLSPWVICFNYCLQSVVSLCCFEGRVWVSVNLSLFPSTFLSLFPWVQNANSLTWLQFFIFFFISSHFFLSLLLCNGSYKYLWEVS